MKTNYLKKCMSMLLSISMIASLFAVAFTASAEETLVVDGVTYNEGDIVELKGELQIEDKWLMNGQVEIPYDSSKLEFIDDESVQSEADMFPTLAAQGIKVFYSALKEDLFCFNYSVPEKGADFTTKSVLYDIKFKVIGTGSIENFADGVKIIDMMAYSFDGSPEGQKVYTMVPVYEDNKIIEGMGVLESEAAPEGETPPAQEETLTVDGKTYKVGESFEFVGELQADKWIMNAQLNITFDSTKLEIEKATFPKVQEAGIEVYDSFNYDSTVPAGFFTFNFSDVNKGVSFAEGGELYNIVFKVNGAGETSLNDKVDLIELSAFPFDDDPANHVGETRLPVSIINDEGTGVDEQYGSIEHAIKEDEVPPEEETLTVDGNVYKVGDIVTYNIDLNTMKWLMNAQFDLRFDSEKLEFISAEYPAVTDSGIEVVDNYLKSEGKLNEDGYFTFNFTDVTKGVDLTSGNCIATISFKAIGTGETSLYDGSKFIVLSTFDFDGSPADPENAGKIPSPVSILNEDGSLTDGNKATFYYGEPQFAEGFTVNGEKVEAGDIVEYRIWIQNDDNWLVNGEFDILYTNYYLDFIDVTYPGLITIQGYICDNHIADSGLKESQGKDAGEFLFNFSNIHSGVDFTEGAYMAILRFRVHESTDPNIPAKGASVIELKDGKVNEMYAFEFAGSGSDHSITEKEKLEKLVDEDGNLLTDGKEFETVVISLDYSALQEAYDKWSQIDDEYYTEESVNNLKAVLDEVKKMLDDLTSGNKEPYTQEMIDQATADLNAAGEALVLNKQPLIDKIAEANKIIEDETNIYVPETIEALKAAVEAAQAVVDDDNATLQDMLDQIATLEEAIKNVKLGAYLGDVDLSWNVTIDDATYTQQYIVQIIPEVFYKVLADVNKDGIITIQDVTEIQKITVNLREKEIVELPTL